MLDPKRYLVLLVVFLAIGISEMAWIVNLWARRTDKDERDEGGFFYKFFRYFNLLGMALFYIPSCYMIEGYGIRVSVTLGLGISTLGLWLSVWGEFTMACVVLGSASPFILNATTKLSARWFGP